MAQEHCPSGDRGWWGCPFFERFPAEYQTALRALPTWIMSCTHWGRYGRFSMIVPQAAQMVACSAPVQGESVIKGFQIFLVELSIIRQLHIIWIRGPLGIDVEHHKAVEAVVQGDALHRFQSIVQAVGGGCGWIDPDADQGCSPRVPRIYRYSE